MVFSAPIGRDTNPSSFPHKSFLQKAMIFLLNKEVRVFICVIIAQLWVVLYFVNRKLNLIPCF